MTPLLGDGGLEQYLKPPQSDWTKCSIQYATCKTNLRWSSHCSPIFCWEPLDPGICVTNTLQWYWSLCGRMHAAIELLRNSRGVGQRAQGIQRASKCQSDEPQRHVLIHGCHLGVRPPWLSISNNVTSTLRPGSRVFHRNIALQPWLMSLTSSVSGFNVGTTSQPPTHLPTPWQSGGGEVGYAPLPLFCFAAHSRRAWLLSLGTPVPQSPPHAPLHSHGVTCVDTGSAHALNAAHRFISLVISVPNKWWCCLPILVKHQLISTNVMWAVGRLPTAQSKSAWWVVSMSSSWQSLTNHPHSDHAHLLRYILVQYCSSLHKE